MTYRIGEQQRRGSAQCPAHIIHGTKGRFRQWAGDLALPDGCACAFEGSLAGRRYNPFSHEMAHLDYFRWCSMLYVFAAVHTLHGEMYFEHEKEGNIRRRCRPDLQSCFPSQLEWAELDEKLTGKLVWPDDSLNYTAYNNQYNIRTHT